MENDMYIARVSTDQMKHVLHSYIEDEAAWLQDRVDTGRVPGALHGKFPL